MKRPLAPALRLATLVVLLAVACFATAATAADDAAVRPLAREWFAFLERRRPEAASQLGSVRAATRLAILDDATLVADAAWIAAFRTRLAHAVPSNTQGAQDRDALLAWCAAESAAVAPGGAWWRDPGAVVGVLEDATFEASRATRPGACDRVQRTAARLWQVPDVLRGAQVVLRAPERAAAERAATRLDSLLVRWRVELPPRFAACRESYRMASLVEADTLALRAGGDFLRWLRVDAIPRAEAGAAPAPPAPLPHLHARLP